MSSLLQPASQKQYDFLTSDAYITVFGGAAASSKAQPLYSKVLTPNGWKTMGDMAVGEIVSTPDGKSAKVIGVYNFDSKPVYEIKTSSGRVVRACSDHLWKVNVPVYKKKSLDCILKTSEIIDLLNQGRKVNLPFYGNPLLLGDSQVPFDPYMMGVLLGDGCLRKSGIRLSSSDQQIIDYFNENLKQYGCKLWHNSRVDYLIVNIDQTQTRNEKGQYVKNNKVSGIFGDLGLIGTGSSDKFIPKVYLNADVNTRLSLLQGLLDSDGYNDIKNIGYCTISKQLCDDVVYLIRSLGGRVTVTEHFPKYTYKGVKKNGQKAYTLYIRFPDVSKYFRLDRKKTPCDVKVFDQIKSIEYIEHDKVRCIAIDSDDHLYITDDFTVTHNTHNGLVRHLRYVHDPRYVGYVIRKHTVNLKGGGGAFDLAQILFKAYNPRVRFTRQPMVAYFPSGAKIQFVGMDGEAGKEFFQGLEVSGAMCDEGTHLSEDEVWWLASRLRTSADMSPNIWITCNPDPDSYLFKWVEWYLYPKGTYVDGELVEGRPDPAKNGKLRWFIKNQDQMIWGDSPEEIYEKYPQYKNSETKPKSFRFIGATCHDNPIFLKKNPDYISTLLNQGRVTAERLYYGNWLAREEASGYFKRDWCEIIDNPPDESQVVKRVRAWDIAGTLPSESYPDPDYTVGVQIAKLKDGSFLIEDVQRDRKRFSEVYNWIAEQALKDFSFHGHFDVFIPQDPAAAGKFAVHSAKRDIAEYGVFVKSIKVTPNTGKLTRFKPFSAAAESGLIKVLKADWNDVFFSELERFDGTRRCGHDDRQTCRQ